MACFNNPGLSPGILPVPNTPLIEKGTPEHYIKRSYFPIPYQVIVAVDGCKVNEVLAWDINVTSKSVKIKVEYSLNESSTIPPTCDLFPKAVVDSISTYNLVQPSWSSSFCLKKLVVRIEWLRVISSMSDNQNNSPNLLFTPQRSPKYNANQDSGYVSSATPLHQTGNISGIYTPYFYPTKLNFNTPVRPVHDVYQPSPRISRKSNTPHIHDSKVETNKFESSVKNQNDVEFHDPKVETSVHDLPAKVQVPLSPTSPTHESPTLQPKDPPPLSDHTTPKQPPTSKKTPNQTTLPPTQHPPITSSPQCQGPPPLPLNTTSQSQDLSQSHDSHEPPTNPKSEVLTFDPEVSADAVLHEKPVSAVKSTDIKSSELPKFTVSKSKTGHIVLHRDPQIDPDSDKFVKAPHPIPKSSKKKFINQKLDAGRMSIVGYCRLCGYQVKSCYADYHLLTCDALDQCELVNFYKEYASKTRGTDCDVEAMAYEYCEFKLSDNDVNNIFDMNTIQSFINELEIILEKRAIDVFKRLGCPDQKRRYNILKY